MAHKLAFFIGKPRYLRNERNALTGEYETVCYDFGDGYVSAPSGVFGVALYAYLNERGGQAVDEILVMGTSGSNWDVLFDLIEARSDAEAWKQLELAEAADNDQVSAAQLAQVEETLCRYLGGPRVTCALVGSAATQAEQLGILQTIADFVAPGDRFSLDITHGFRHMGLVALESSLLLSQVRGIRVDGIYYGNFMAKSAAGHATVDTMVSVDQLSAWARALSLFRHNGLLGDLPGLLEAQHPGIAAALRNLNFALMTNRTRDIASSAGQAVGMLRKLEPDDASNSVILRLFRDDLLAELDHYTGSDLAKIQLDLARKAFQCGDYLRCAIYSFEAIISAAAGPSCQRDGQKRTRIAKVLNDYSDDYFSPETRTLVQRLRHFRNGVAHGSEKLSREIQEVLKSDHSCRTFLGQAMYVAGVAIERFNQDPALRENLFHLADC